jgi:hypothetical protein
MLSGFTAVTQRGSARPDFQTPYNYPSYPRNPRLILRLRPRIDHEHDQEHEHEKERPAAFYIRGLMLFRIPLSTLSYFLVPSGEAQ